MPSVNPEECKACRFWKNCAYLWSEAGNITALVPKKPDGSCQLRQPKEEDQDRSGENP